MLGLKLTHFLAGTQFSKNWIWISWWAIFHCFFVFQVVNTALGILADEDFEGIGSITLQNALWSAGRWVLDHDQSNAVKSWVQSTCWAQRSICKVCKTSSHATTATIIWWGNSTSFKLEINGEPINGAQRDVCCLKTAVNQLHAHCWQCAALPSPACS